MAIDNDEDGHRIEAAEQFGFVSNEDGNEYACTEAQLIAFAKACERAGWAQATRLLRGVACSGLPDASVAGAARALVDQQEKLIAAFDVENAPILEHEARQFLTGEAGRLGARRR